MSEPVGLVLVDKPVGVTSHDVVGRVRRALGTRRVGHAGTLDPFATGLVVCAVGEATRLLGWLALEPKWYDVRITFGTATDTDDPTGTPVAHGPPADLARLDAALAALTGPVEQVPPAFSAKHVAGERAYALARAGAAVALAPVPVTVHAWEVRSATPDAMEARVAVGTGTYVRALARDLGPLLGTVAHCGALRRTATGALDVRAAVPFAALAPDAPPPLLDPRPYLADCVTEVLDEAGRAALAQGRRIIATRDGERVAFTSPDGRLLGVGERVTGRRAAGSVPPRADASPEAGGAVHPDERSDATAPLGGGAWQPRVVFRGAGP